MTQALINDIRAQFPALHQEVNGKPLVYLDNGATTQKPQCVIDALSDYYRLNNSNVHRGAHTLSDRATQQFEDARKTLQAFLNANKSEEVVWTRGTTESINLVAATWGRQNIKAGDEILVSGMEHHSNIVPWQMLCEQTGATLRPIPVKDNGELDMEAFTSMLNDKVKLVGVVHVSNALGTINPVADIIKMSHDVGAKVLVDGAQAVAHWDVDVQALDVDFYAFSGHKLFGPTGIGVLYGKEELLNAMPPYQGGGEMIEHCSFDGTTYNVLPFKFEAGTPNIVGAIGLGSAIDYISKIKLENIFMHEQKLLEYITNKMNSINNIKIIGTAKNKTGILSFIVKNVHPNDIGTILDKEGIAVRTGHHCCQPLMNFFGISATVRVSFGVYNTIEEIDNFLYAIKNAINLLR